ncbi:helix-turn-helix domain-containing protein [Streptomyces sp. 2323.1]|uniref:helix-turn-helix domain-containing protein n=1 Tax=Streptomyces sp. 2323.1 TaxID=1938841 RepID=UPI000BB81ACC
MPSWSRGANGRTHDGEPADRTRLRQAARILDGARELAVEHGVRKVTIAEIAAGVGKGTVHLYWETKGQGACTPWTRRT